MKTLSKQPEPENQPENSPEGMIRGHLYEILEKGDWAIRIRAAGVLVDLNDPRGWAFLASAIRHPERDIRGAVVEVLEEYGGLDAVDMLENTLDDQDPEIRVAAARALDALYQQHPPKNPGILAIVNTILQGRDPFRLDYSLETAIFLTRMEMVSGLAGMTATLLALGFLFAGIDKFRLPFLLLVIAAIGGFTGSQGAARRDPRGYTLALTGSLLLLPGVPVFTIPGLVFLIRLLREDVRAAFYPKNQAGDS